MDCDKCNLCNYAHTVKVSPRGSDKPIVLFVGEAPGSQEDNKGTSFIGPAGQKLDVLIKQAGIDPAICRFTNVVRCIPRAGSSVRPPEQSEIDACAPYLEQEIIRTKPVFIVPLGLTAIKHLVKGAATVTGARGKRSYVEYPSVKTRYDKYLRWAKHVGKAEVKIHHVEHKMLAQMEEAEKEGFPHIEPHVCTVYPSFHPAAILRGNVKAEQSLLEDLKYVAAQISGPASNNVDSQYEYLDTLDKIKTALDYWRDEYRSGRIKYVVVDVETTTKTVFLCGFYELLLFSIAGKEGEAKTIPFRHTQSPFRNDAMKLAAVRSLVNEFLEEVPVVGHNIKYDINALNRAGLYVKHVYDDTYLGSWTLFNDTVFHDLETLASQFTSLVAHKDEMALALKDLPPTMPLEIEYHRDDGEVPIGCTDDYESGDLYRPSHYGDIEIDLLHRYCCRDADTTLRLQVVFQKMMEDLNLWNPHSDLTVKAIIPTARMEQVGIKIDKEAFKESDEEFRSKIDSYVSWFVKHGYLEDARKVLEERRGKKVKEAKLSSPDVKGVILYDLLMLTVVKKTKKKAPSADKEALSILQNDVQQKVGTKKDVGGRYTHIAECLSNMIAFNKDNKLYTSYIRPIPNYADEQGLGHCGFGIRTTETGRYSCREPSWHTVPWHSVVKKAIIPHEKKGLILSTDYSQAELRVLAMVSQDASMIRAFLDGKDLHRFVASVVLGKPEEEVTTAERRRFKAVVFGLIFGRQAPAIAAQEKISVAEAQGTIDRFFELFPGTKAYIASKHREAKQTGQVWTSSGFRRLLPDTLYSTAEVERRAQNTPIQGPASDLTVHALIALDDKLQKSRYQSKVWTTVHDAIDFSVYPGELYGVARLAKKCMVDYVQHKLDWLTVPVSVDYEVGVTWGHFIDMSVEDNGEVEFDGISDYSDLLTERVLSWDQPPELLSMVEREDQDDDGKPVLKTKSRFKFAT